ncbi:hypothetical protein HK104_003388 [Borealophlyctis nickersoniae]|nr:hypothetical protein HK104_003388 [Borealophlyctis nickersoniae]
MANAIACRLPPDSLFASFSRARPQRSSSVLNCSIPKAEEKIPLAFGYSRRTTVYEASLSFDLNRHALFRLRRTPSLGCRHVPSTRRRCSWLNFARRVSSAAGNPTETATYYKGKSNGERAPVESGRAYQAEGGLESADWPAMTGKVPRRSEQPEDHGNREGAQDSTHSPFESVNLWRKAGGGQKQNVPKPVLHWQKVADAGLAGDEELGVKGSAASGRMSAENVQRCWTWYDRQSAVGGFKRYELSHLISVLVHANRDFGAVAKAERVMKDMQVAGWTPSVMDFARLMAIYLHHGDFDKTRRTFNTMRETCSDIPLLCYNLLLRCEARSLNAAAAEKVFLEIQERGLSPDRETYIHLVKVHIRCDNQAMADRRLEEMESALGLLDADGYKALIIFSAARKKVEASMSVFARMSMHGIVPSSSAFNALLRMFDEMGDGENSRRVMQSMASLRIKPDRDTYATLFNALQRGNVDAVLDCLQEAANAKAQPPSAVQCSRALRILINSGRLKDAIRCYEICFTLGVVTTPFLAIRLRRAIEEGALEDIGECYLEYQKRNYIPPPVLHAGLFSGLVMAKKYDIALGCLEDMVHNPGADPDPLFCLRLLHAFIEPANLGSAVRCYAAALRLGSQPSAVEMNKVINKLAACGGIHEADEIIRMMRMAGVNDPASAPNMTTYNALIEGCSQISDEKGMLKTLRMLVREGVKRDLYTHAAIITLYRNLGDMVTAQWWFGNCHQELGTPPLFIWSLVISGHLQFRDLPLAQANFDQMKRFGIEPDATIFTAFISYHSSYGNLGEAERWAADMLSRGIAPTAQTMTVLCTLAAKRKDLDRALQLWTEMHTYGIQPDVQAFTSLMAVYASAGAAKGAQRVFDQMIKERVFPTRETYVTLATAYARTGDTSSANRVLKKMKSTGIHPTSATHMALAQAYAAAGDVTNMTRHFAAHSVMSPEGPVEKLWAVVLRGHAKVGDVEGSFATEQMLRESGARHLDLQCWKAILEARARKGDLIEFGEAWKRMRDDGVRPDAPLVGRCVKAIVEGLGGKAGWNIVDWAKREGVELNVYCFHPMLTAAANNGDLQEMKRCFNKMQDASVEPTDTTWGIVMKVLLGANRRGLVVDVWDAMKGNEAARKRCEKVRLNVHAYPPGHLQPSANVAVVLDCAPPKDALRMWRDLVRENYPLTNNHFTSLVETLVRAGEYEDAVRAIEDAEYAPIATTNSGDAAAVDTCVDAAAAAGTRTPVSGGLVVPRNVRAFTKTFVNIIGMLAGKQRREEAIRVLNVAKKRGPHWVEAVRTLSEPRVMAFVEGRGKKGQNVRRKLGKKGQNKKVEGAVRGVGSVSDRAGNDANAATADAATVSERMENGGEGA